MAGKARDVSQSYRRGVQARTAILPIRLVLYTRLAFHLQKRESKEGMWNKVFWNRFCSYAWAFLRERAQEDGDVQRKRALMSTVNVLPGWFSTHPDFFYVFMIFPSTP